MSKDIMASVSRPNAFAESVVKLTNFCKENHATGDSPYLTVDLSFGVSLTTGEITVSVNFTLDCEETWDADFDSIEQFESYVDAVTSGAIPFDENSHSAFFAAVIESEDTKLKN